MTTTPSTFAPRWAAAVAEIGRRELGGPRLTYSFSYGLPDPTLFPLAALEEASRQVLATRSDRALQYGGGGNADLVAGLIARVNRQEGLNLRPENCLITAGASQAIAMAVRALVDPGDPVLLEVPAWTGVQAVLRRVLARPLPVPLDAEGLDVAALEATLAAQAGGVRPQLLYLVPSFQNPAGVTMPLARRRALLALARRYDLMIVEDEAYRDLAFDAAPPPSLLALDEDGRVLRLGTYSKILAPGLRLGWVFGPPEALARLAAFQHGELSPFSAFIAATYSATGALEPHIAELVAVYRRKRDVMLAALARYMPEGVTWTTPDGGFFIWVTLPPGHDAARLQVRAREQDVDFLPGRTCFPDPAAGARFLRLAFSLLSDAQIEEGIRRLGGLVAGTD